MGEFDMIEDEIRKKRQRIEECEDDYRRSYKKSKISTKKQTISFNSCVI